MRNKRKSKPLIKIVAAIVIGNALEWYDFMIYSFMTIYIANLFFPASHAINSLLAATASMGVAFCVRPLSGMLIGLYADKYGRRPVLIYLVLFMSLASFIMAITPTYAQIGMLAPLLIVLSRLLQGICVSAEFGTASAVLIELAPYNKRGLYGSWQIFGQMVALLLGGMLGFMITHFINTKSMEAWGWRIPFIVGSILAPVGFYIRQHLNESVLQQSITPAPHQTIHNKKSYFGRVFLVMGLNLGGTASIYINISYLPIYVTQYLHLSMNMAFSALLVGASMLVLLVPFFGLCSDYIGGRIIIISALLIYLLTLYPLFAWLTQAPSFFKLLMTEIIFCFLLSAYFGAFIAAIVELFPKEIRVTSLSLSNNVAVMLFGGFGQFFLTWLIKATASLLAPCYYLLPAVAVSLLAAIFLPEERKIYELN